MRLYGALQELTSLVIRLASGKTVKIQSAEQTAAGETQITIPDVVDGADELVLKDTAVTMTNKTLTSPVVTNIDIQSSFRIKLPTAEPAVAEVGKLYYHSGRLKISNSAVSATAHDKVVTEVSTDTLQNKSINATANTITEIDPAASFRTVLANADKVVKYDASGIPSVSKIVNANVDAAAGIDGSKLADGSIPAAKLSNLSSADLAGKVSDETGSGSLVFANSPTLTTPSIAQINTPSQSLAVSGTGALTLPAGNNTTQRPGTPANGMIRYNSTDNTFEGYSNGAWAGIGGGGTTDKVSQASHGFVVGDVLYLNGSVYAKAIATAANTAEVVGVVSRVIDASTFEMTLSGEISGLTGLTAGEVYFLSASTAGLLTLTEPSVVGQVSIPVGVASSASTLYVAPKRGVVVGAANARTTISVANNAATNVVDVTNYNSLKLEGELNVTRSSGGNHRAYYTVEAAKNGAGVWQVSASYTGDDVLYTTLPSWDVAANNLQVTMPLVTNFSSASLTYALNAPAVGATLPLSIDSTALNIVDSAPLSYRNRIINGNFDIWQRGTSQTSTGYGSDDRWKNEHNGSTKTHSQQAFTLGQTAVPGNPKYFSRTAVTSVAGASNFVSKAQVIESVQTFAGETITLSFWAKADASKNVAVEFVQYFGSGGSPSASVTGITTTVALTSSWSKQTITVTLPSISGKTLGSNNDDGLVIYFWLDAGSSFNARTNSLGQQSGTFDIAQVQLEVGSKASAFERRPYGMELQLCQRYYQRGFNGRVANGAFSTTGVLFWLPYIVTMRTAATPSLIAGASLTAAIDKTGINSITPNSVTGGSTSINGGYINFACPAASFTAYQPCGLNTDIIEVSAEL